MIPISLFIQFFFMSSLREVFKKNKTNKVDRDHFNFGKDDTHTNQYQPPCQHMDICQPVPTLTNQKIKSQVKERKQDLFKFPPFTNQYKPMQTHANLCQPLQTLTTIIQPSKGCLPKKNSIWRDIVLSQQGGEVVKKNFEMSLLKIPFYQGTFFKGGLKIC